MPGLEEGAGFRIVGKVKRMWFAQSLKCAEITVVVNMYPHPAEHRLKTFDRILIGDMKRDLRDGQRVQFTGKIENEKLTDRSRAEVMADGKVVWVSVLRPKSYEVEGSSRAAGTAGRPVTSGRVAASEPAPADEVTDPFAAGEADPLAGDDPMGGGSDPFGG